MIQDDADGPLVELNGFVEAFEAAFAEHDEVDLAEFLPHRDHPLYLAARRELLRVDLELHWLDGRRTGLRDYAQRFPDLLEDRDTVQEVAFEEYRLRLLAGEEVSPEEYEQAWGVNTTGWATSRIVPVGPAPAAPEAPAYQDRQSQATQSDRALVLNFALRSTQDGSWHSSRHGDVARAMLLQNVHQSDTEAAFLLAQAMTDLPGVGATFLNFQLIAELGHGSFSRVYLARQGDLANRLVALKITVDLLGEEQKLAQLQHTNVVPVYSIHQAGPFQAVCMPYFGSTTLGDVIRAVHDQASRPKSGKDLVHLVQRRKKELLARIEQRKDETGAKPSELARLRGEAGTAATLEMLAESSYVAAVFWIAERVIEGLIHAHEHGILHRDLKPANILLTDEGQPMLLDFNLSADTKVHAGLDVLYLGGTLPYMAPEHMQAMQGSGGTTDVRCDLYALGVVLFELLTGRLPFEARSGPLTETLPAMIADRLQAPPRLRGWNPAVSPAAESIVRHCLQPEPGQRYQSAQELQEDLKRQRQDRPLQYAPEPSLRERAQKWVRRHPRLASPMSAVLMALLVVIFALVPSTWQKWQEWQSARALDLAKVESALARAESADAETEKANEYSRRAREEALRMVAQLNRDKVRAFYRAASSRPIMEIVNAIQILPEARPYEEKNLALAVDECRKSLSPYRVLEDPRWQLQPMVTGLPPADRDMLLAKVAELLYALARAEQVPVARLVSQSRQHATVSAAQLLPGCGREIWGAWAAVIQTRLQTVLALNEQAHACVNGDLPRYLVLQRAELAQLQGDFSGAQRLQEFAETIPLATDTDECYWIASMLVAQDKFPMARPLLQEATRQSPSLAGAWLLLALCHHNQGDIGLAETCYNTYLNLQPDGIWGYYHRGLLFLAKRDWSLAESDFDQVLEKHRDLALAYSQRAAARKGMKKYSEAIRDLGEAIRLAPELDQLYYVRAQIHALAGNAERAKLDRLHVLDHEPTHPIGWTYRGLVRAANDPRGALVDFDKALALNPYCPLTLYNKACLLADVLGRQKNADDLRHRDEAILVLDRLLQQNDRFVEARFKRAFLLAELGNRARAVADAELMIRHEPTPRVHYQAATIYAMTSSPQYREDAKRAIELLSYALRNGYGVDLYQSDPLLRPLANYDKFRRLAQGLEILGAGNPPRMRP